MLSNGAALEVKNLMSQASYRAYTLKTSAFPPHCVWIPTGVSIVLQVKSLKQVYS